MRKEKHRTGKINTLSKHMKKTRRTNSYAYGDVIVMADVIKCPKCQLWEGTLRDFVDKHKPKCLRPI